MNRLVTFFCIFSYSCALGQSDFTAGNPCTVRIQTDCLDRNFRSNDLSVLLNRSLMEFEFRIPITSLFSFTGPASDKSILEVLASGSEYILISAELPQDKDGSIDFSYFRGNEPVKLKTRLEVGSRKWITEMYLTGMTFSDNENMLFNFQVYINAGTFSEPIKIQGEQLSTFEIFGKAEKLIRL